MTRKKFFVNREKELELLERLWKSGKFEFVVIYGRRRVGKTRLIKEFIKDKNSIYFLCSIRKVEYNLAKFSEKVCRYLGIPVVKFGSFQEAFDAILSKKDRAVIVIDEFGYLVRQDPGVLSDFQEIVDEKLSNTEHMLILCGSSISMMETRVLGYGSPLYGRASRYMRIKALPFKCLRQWFPKTPVEELIKIYGVCGGVPKYLEFFSGENVEREIVEKFFDASSFLYNDAINILSEELRDYTTYLQVLEAIALGYTKLTEIANYAYVKAKDVYFYLKVLSSLGIVRRKVPIFSDRRSKRGIYEIVDNYFKFWFSFISPFQSDIESYNLDPPIANFKRKFDAFLGQVFEKLVLELVRMGTLKLPFTPTRIGRWWHKDVEIDLVAVNDLTREILFCETKWSKNIDPVRVMEKLTVKASNIGWNKGNRKEYYLILARSFKRKISAYNQCKVFCYDLNDIEKFLH